MSITARVNFRDLGLAEITSAVARLGAARVEAGVVGADAERVHPEHGDLTMGELMAINEYGSEAAGVPARAPLRTTFERVRGELVDALNSAVRRVISTRVSAVAALAPVGRLFAERIKDSIAQGLEPPNAPATIRRKGFDHPLIDSGELLHAISSRVVQNATLGEGGAVVESADLEGGGE